MLSVALCTYNGERYIEEQIQSILTQTQAVDEIVICDDSSTDGTLPIVEHLAASAQTAIRVYPNSKGLGVVENFKKAASLCQGDIIFFADQDDRWLPDKVSTIVRYFAQHPGVSVVFSDAWIIDSDGAHKDTYGNLFQMTFQKEEQRMFHAGLGLESFLARNHATGATMAVRKRFLDTAQPFSLCTRQILHDYALALRATEMGMMGIIGTPLIDYRRHDKGQTVFEIPEAGKISKWYTYYDQLRELWPNGEVEPILPLLTANHAQERISYITTRNRDLHRPLAPLAIPLRMNRYRSMYGTNWRRIMRYDLSQCLRYSWQRLTHRIASPTSSGEKLQNNSRNVGKKLQNDS